MRTFQRLHRSTTLRQRTTVVLLATLALAGLHTPRVSAGWSPPPVILPLQGDYSMLYRPPDLTAWDGNRCVPDPVGQVQRLRAVGEIMGYRMGAGHPHPACGWLGLGCDSHWQGIQRLPMAGGQHFAVSMSEKEGEYLDGAWLAFTHMESRPEMTGRRLGGNRMSPFSPDWNVAPSTLDRIVLTHRIDEAYWHPGGMQALGRYLFVPLEKGPGVAQVVVYDMGGLETRTLPREIGRFGLHDGGASSVAVAKLELTSNNGSRYVMAVTPGSDSKALAFYLAAPGRSLDEVRTNQVPLQGPYSLFGEPGDYEAFFRWDDIANFRTYFQNINLITDCTGQLYLLGTTGGGRTRAELEGWQAHGYELPPEGQGSVDRVELYALTITPGADPRYAGTTHTVQLQWKASNIMHCTAKDDARQCDFDAAAGSYVDPDGRLLLYATEHDNDGPAGSVKMMEFRPSDHLDTLDTSIVEGCPHLETAFVELYDNKLNASAGNGATSQFPTSQKSLFMEGRTIGHRDDGHFDVAYNMNDQVQAMRWCVPNGFKVSLFKDANFSNTAEMFLGTGQIQGYQWGSNPQWSSGCFMKSTSFACCTSAFNCPDSPPSNGGGGGGGGGACNGCRPTQEQ